MPLQHAPEQLTSAMLVINPAASRAKRLVQSLPAITALLRSRGFAVTTVETSLDTEHAQRAIAAACQSPTLLLACGGDGTVHAVVQAIAGRIASQVTLGVVPLGTANALAHNLGLPLDPLLAVTRLLTYEPRLIPLGAIQSATTSRSFIAMAGCGPDGALAHDLRDRAPAKDRFGRGAYALHAARLYLTRRWPTFRVEYRCVGDSAWQTTDAIALMVSRLPNLGGIFSRLTPLAALTQAHLHVQMLRPPAQLSLPAWFAAAHSGLPIPRLRTVDAEELRCTALSSAPVFAQADAEPIGPLPLTMRIDPDALRLLMPRETRRAAG